MENNIGKVSVCMATYNGSKYIHEQITSILSQIRDCDELIISDDSSTDDTLDIIKSFEDKRIKIFPNQSYKSPIFNFENALNKASGEYLFLADQDDIWLESKVKEVVKILQFYDVVTHDCFYVDNEKKIILESFFEWRNAKKGFIKNLYKNRYLGCCMAFKRSILTKALPFPKNIPMHDIWLGLVSELFFKTHFLNKKLILYRRHDSNTTQLNANNKSPFTLMAQAKFRIANLINILKLLFKHYI